MNELLFQHTSSDRRYFGGGMRQVPLHMARDGALPAFGLLVLAMPPRLLVPRLIPPRLPILRLLADDLLALGPALLGGGTAFGGTP